MSRCPKCGGPTCDWCGRHVRSLNQFGRPPAYCSETHRRLAARARKKDKRKQTTVDCFDGQVKLL